MDSDSGTPRSARLVGILLTFVETDKPKWRGTLHNRVRGGGLPPDMLSRWARELEVYVAELHQAGVVWGDAKPYIVLVDRHDSIWINDFGGAYTDGWVDEDKSETMEGDRQGVARIQAFLEGFRTKALLDCPEDEAEAVNAAQD